MSDLPKQLKVLVHEYRKSEEPEVLARIIRVSRPVIFYTLHTLRKYRAHLREYEEEELYGTAVIGISKFIHAVKDGWPTDAVIPRLISYMMAEVSASFRYRPQVHYVPSHVIDKTTCSTEQEVRDKQLEIRDQFNALIADEVITLDEFEILSDYVVDGVTQEDLASARGVARITIQRRITAVLGRVRREWARRGWEEEL